MKICILVFNEQLHTQHFAQQSLSFLFTASISSSVSGSSSSTFFSGMALSTGFFCWAGVKSSLLLLIISDEEKKSSSLSRSLFFLASSAYLIRASLSSFNCFSASFLMARSRSRFSLSEFSFCILSFSFCSLSFSYCIFSFSL